MDCKSAAIVILVTLCPTLALAANARGPARVIVAAQTRVDEGFSVAHESHAQKFLHQAHKTRSGADVYYVAEALDKLKLATAKQQFAAEQRYDLERLRLTAATEQALLPADRSLLEATVEATEESKMEEMNAFKAMYNMYYTMKAAFGAAATAPSCEFMTCGEHGRCVSDGVAASCQCKPCFEGNGFMCKPSTCSPTKSFTAQPMSLHLKQAPAMQDVTVAVFGQNRLAAAFRDEKQGGRGFLMLGTAGEADIKWSQMQSYSKNLKAFSPQIVVMPTGRIVVQFRDALKDGTGYLVGGRVDESDPSKAIMLKPVGFVRGQSEAAVLVSLASSRVVCLFAHPKGPKEQPHGGAIFLQAVKGGSISVIGKYRFANHAVTEIAAVALRPNSFVVAYRDPPRADEPSNALSRELSVVWMSMQDQELVVDPHPIVIEPETKEMGARSLALVSENLFSYSYQSNSERKTKVAIVRVDPDTHRMTVTDTPKEVSSGDTAFVKSISLPFQSLAPHTLTYLQPPGKNGVAETCRISPRGKITGCQELPWANARMSSVSAARLGDGRLVFVFGDDKKDPFYQMLGAPGA